MKELVKKITPVSTMTSLSIHIKEKISMIKFIVPSTILVATMVLVLHSTATFAQQTQTGEQWSEWQALGEGYVARRKVPANIKKPVTQRRTKAVQKRLVKLELLLQRELDKLENIQAGSGNQRQVLRTERKIIALQKRIQREQRRLAYKSKTRRPDSLWLRTASEGLHEVPVGDLALELGLKKHILKIRLERGLMTLTNAGNPVSWHYDPDTDTVLFPGTRYDTFYTDQNAYLMNPRKSIASQPMLVSGQNTTIALGSDTPFIDTLHFEQEPDMNFATWAVASEPDADYWFWDYLYGGFKDLIEVPLAVPNPSPTGTAQMRVTLRGWTDLDAGDEHQVFAELNGVPVGPTITWDGFAEAVLVAEFDQSLLDPNGNNILSLRNLYPAGSHPGQFLDAIEVDYARQPVSVDNKLWLHDVESGVQTVTGFTSDQIMVIESPMGESLLRRDARVEPDTAGGFMVTFETQGNTDFLVTDRGNSARPMVQVDIPSDLDLRRNVAQYLIIAPRDFTGTAEALATHRLNRYRHVKIVWLDDIYDQFSYGREDPFALSAFINHAYNQWRIAPSMIVLIGKGTLDHRDRMGYADSFLPVIFTDTPWSLAASDDRLLGANGDAPFAIGRLPITNDDEGIAYVNKLISYESTTPGEEKYSAVLVADDPDNAGEFHSNSDQLADRLANDLEFETVAKLYHPQDNVRNELILSSTWETGYVSYDGHGSSTQVGSGFENFIKAADAEALQNENYPIFSALTCAVGDSTHPGSRSLADALVLNPNGGAIASMAPAGLSLDQDAQILGNAFVDGLYGSYNTIGDAVMEAKIYTKGVTNDFMQRMYTVVGDPAVYAR